MPYHKLTKMRTFSKLRIRQLWDDCRIEAAHYSSIKHGKVIVQKGKRKTLNDCINRYARARGLLLALGYVVKHGYKSKKKTTPEFKEMFKKAWPRVKRWYKYYKGRVKKLDKK